MKTGLILVDVESYMSSVSLVESGKLKEHYVEYKQASNITGNIYKGKVVNVLTGLQSAFVNFGSARNGFLSVEEALGHKTVLGEAGVMPKLLDVKEGDYVMVQATKEEIGTKGARLTTTVTLPGRYVIFLPNLDFVGVSNKIPDPDIREKLTEFLTKIKPDGSGFIARTACLEAKKNEITTEVKRLILQWKKIVAAYNEAEDIKMVYSDGDLIFRTVRDMLSSNIEAIVCNDADTVRSLTQAMKERNIKFYDKVRYYEGQYDMFDAFNILGEVDKLLDRRVKLKSGVNLIFDYTEALTVIDVNTAQFARGTNPEEGAMIVRAVTRYLNRQDAVTVLTTHYDGVAQEASAHYEVVGLRDMDTVRVKGEIAMASPEQGADVIAAHMNYGLYRVEREQGCPRDALNICRLLSLTDEILSDIETLY